MKITTKWLEEAPHIACPEARAEFASYKGDTDSIAILKTLIKKERSDWANWLCARLLNHKQLIKYAIYAAEQVIEVFEKQYPDDKSPRKAIEAAKAVLKHNTKTNRKAANAAADAAYAAAYAADAAAYSAADAAYSAAYAADAAYSAANAAYAADAASYLAAKAANAAIKIKIIRYGIKLLQRNK